MRATHNGMQGIRNFWNALTGRGMGRHTTARRDATPAGDSATASSNTAPSAASVAGAGTNFSTEPYGKRHNSEHISTTGTGARHKTDMAAAQLTLSQIPQSVQLRTVLAAVALAACTVVLNINPSQGVADALDPALGAAPTSTQTIPGSQTLISQAQAQTDTAQKGRGGVQPQEMNADCALTVDPTTGPDLGGTRVSVHIPKSTKFTKVRAMQKGKTDGMAVSEDGTLYTWGKLPGDGVYTNGNNSMPSCVDLPNHAKVKDIAGENTTRMVLDATGKVLMWGDYSHGELGNGTDMSNKPSADIPVYGSYILKPVNPTFPAGVTIASIDVAANASFAIDTDGNLWGWGQKNALGYGNVGGYANVPTKISVAPGDPKLKSFDAHDGSAIAVDVNGNVYTWVYDASLPASTVPDFNMTKVAMPAGAGPVAKAITRYFAYGSAVRMFMVLTTNGQVYNWGPNSGRFLGDGSTVSSETTSVRPSIPAGTVITDISISDGYYVGASLWALDDQGGIYTWGAYDEALEEAPTPPAGQTAPAIKLTASKVSIPGGTTFASIGRNLAVSKAGDLYYGKQYNSTQDIHDGISRPGKYRLVPITIQGNRVLTSAGAVVNSFTYDAGTDSWVGYTTPYKVTNISLGYDTQPISFSYKVDGRSQPSFGYKESFKYTLSPTYQVHFDAGKGSGAPADETVAQGEHAIRPGIDPVPPSADQVFLGWSSAPNSFVPYDFDQPINATTTLTARYAPFSISPTYGSEHGGTTVTVKTPLDSKFFEVSAGNGFTVARAANGDTYAWGRNDSGQLGAGSSVSAADQDKPVKVATPAGVKFTQLSAGTSSVTALGTDGKAYAWGANAAAGKTPWLGTGTTDSVLTVPTAVKMPAGVKFTQVSQSQSLNPANSFTLALGDDGNTYAWGNNNNQAAAPGEEGGVGTLGNGTTVSSATPVQVQLPQGVRLTQLSAGGNFALALGNDSNVYAWGTNTRGQLGNGTTVSSSVPVKVSTPANLKFTSVFAGYNSGFTPSPNSGAYVWGANSGTVSSAGISFSQDGTLGTGTAVDQPTPVSVQSGKRITFISSSQGSTLFHASSVYATGANASGQLGLSNTTQTLTPTPVQVPSGGNANQMVPFSPSSVTVSNGTAFALASSLGSSGKFLYSWGADSHSQRGVGAGKGDTMMPSAVYPPLINVTGISFGTGSSAKPGTKLDWDRGSGNWNVTTPAGAVGVTTVTIDWKIANGATQTPVTFDYTYIAAPLSFTVSFDVAGSSSAAPADQTVLKGDKAQWPADPAPPAGKQIFTGWYLDGSNTLYSFDKPVTGNIQLKAHYGTYTVDPTHGPVTGGNTMSITMPLSSKITSVSANTHNVTYAQATNGDTYVWGSGDGYQYGDGKNSSNGLQGKINPDGVKFTQISSESYAAIALGSDGNAYAWGFNQPTTANTVPILNVGSTANNVASPTKVVAPAGVKFTQVSMANPRWGQNVFVLALGDDGQTYAWGNNNNQGGTAASSDEGGVGTLGDGTIANSATAVKVQQPAGVKFTKLSAGANFAMALGNDGHVYTWGTNTNGQLGNGSTAAYSNVPVMVDAPGVTFNDIEAGHNSAFAIDSTGAVWAWGRNSGTVAYNYLHSGDANMTGALGDGTTVDQSKPVKVKLNVPIAQVSSKYGSTFALDKSGHVWAWGANGRNQLGLTYSSPQAVGTPTQVKFLDGRELTATRVESSGFFSYALDSQNNLWGWGDREFQQLGTTSTKDKGGATQPTPVLCSQPFYRIDANTIYFGTKQRTASSSAWDADAQLWTLRVPSAASAGPGPVTVEMQYIAIATIHYQPNYTFTYTYDPVDPVYTVSFDVAGSTSAAPPSQSVTKGKLAQWPADDPTPPSGQQAFTGWYEASSSTPYMFDKPVTGNVKLQAKYGSYEVSPKRGPVTGGNTVSITMPLSSKLMKVEGGRDSFAFGQAANGDTYGWGANGHYDLGTGNTAGGEYPQGKINPDGVKFTQISTLGRGAVAIGSDGNAYAWGINSWQGSLPLLNVGSNETYVKTATKVVKPAGVTFTQISAAKPWALANEFVLAIGSDGNTYAWGNNNNQAAAADEAGGVGTLGNGTIANSATAVKVSIPAGVKFTQVSAGGNFAMALGDDGHIYTWGSNGNGQLGYGTTVAYSNVPVMVDTGATTFKQVSAGYQSAFAIDSAGNLWAWGRNSGTIKYDVDGNESHRDDIDATGMLGDGTATDQRSPVKVNINGPITQVSSSFGSTLALDSAGHIWSWGYNSKNQLGLGHSVGTSVTTPTQVKLADGSALTATSVSAARFASYAVDGKGKAWGWGYEEYGRAFSTAVGDPALYDTPKIISPSFYTLPQGSMSFGDAQHLSEGEIWDTEKQVWRAIVPAGAAAGPVSVNIGDIVLGGNNAQPDYRFQYTYDPVNPVYTVSFDVKDSTSAAPPNQSVSKGDKATWPADPAPPTGQQAFTGWYESGASTPYTFTTAVTKNIALEAHYGAYSVNATHGPLAGGKTMDITMPLSSKVLSVNAGNDHFAFAQATNGDTYSWGNNNDQQLGTDKVAGAGSPSGKINPDGVKFTQISAGRSSAVAIGSDGNTYTWGENSRVGTDAWLGTGQTGTHLQTPTVVPAPASGAHFTQVSMSTDADSNNTFVLAIGDDGLTYAWGNNSNQAGSPEGGSGTLGNGTTVSSNQPVAVTLPAGVKFTQVSAGANFAMALGDDGNVYTWGSNGHGQLGTGAGSAASSNVPVMVNATLPTGVKFTQVSAGHHSAFAIDSSGNVWAWGRNSGTVNSPTRAAYDANMAGGLGDGTDVDQYAPKFVQAGTFTKVSSRYGSTLALDSAGHVWAWGDNSQGQLGLGSSAAASVSWPNEIKFEDGTPLTVADIDEGGSSSYARDVQDNLWVWGSRDSGALGNDSLGSAADTTSATPIASAPRFYNVSDKTTFTTADGTQQAAEIEWDMSKQVWTVDVPASTQTGTVQVSVDSISLGGTSAQRPQPAYAFTYTYDADPLLGVAALPMSGGKGALIGLAIALAFGGMALGLNWYKRRLGA